MAVLVSFKDVGRGRRSWEAKLPRFDAGLIEKEVRKNGGLMSSGIDVDFDPATQDGEIFVGGFRHVGSFTVSLAPA